MYRFFEFFCGGGMARLGLGPDWRCDFANDIDPTKADSYRRNHGGGSELRLKDIADVSPKELPGQVDLAWASFPCQDLSLAGKGAGLKGDRSGTFWSYWSLMRALARQDRHPRLIVLENVCGALTSHGGRDFNSIAKALGNGGYRFGALIIDASLFLPQSRPRLFVIGVRDDLWIPDALRDHEASGIWHPPSVIGAWTRLPKALVEKWIWWNLPIPPRRKVSLADLLEPEPTGVRWHDRDETEYLLSLMSERNLQKVRHAKQLRKLAVGCVYRRTRPDGKGGKIQRAEVRFDGVAGCLRTPSGGSSRQTILVIQGNMVRSRLLSSREVGRLMGLPDCYKLPERYNDAYQLAGDGVVVPVVDFLARELFEPILLASASERQMASSAA